MLLLMHNIIAPLHLNSGPVVLSSHNAMNGKCKCAGMTRKARRHLEMNSNRISFYVAHSICSKFSLTPLDFFRFSCGEYESSDLCTVAPDEHSARRNEPRATSSATSSEQEA